MRFAVYGTGGWAEAAARPSPHGPGNAWTLTTSIGGDGWTTTDYFDEHGIRDNLVAFAAAVRGQAPYPISGMEMIDTIALMEAIVRSAEKDGATEAVEVHSSLNSAS
jgi:predicted dehydrogenase